MTDFHSLSPAICFENVTKKFGEQVVLDNLNFNIPKGKITTILGFSGAGKSTLLKHILGLMWPSRGKISVLGEDLSRLEKADLRKFRQHFGMLFQYAALFDSFTAIENVAFPLREFSSLSREEINERSCQLLLDVGLSEESHFKLPAQLSGGMRKRVGLARALALSPAIILYDEPTTGLDPITTAKVNDLIVATSQKNESRQMTSIIISHDVKASLRISDFIAFLNRGRIIEYLPTSEFVHSKNELIQKFINL